MTPPVISLFRKVSPASCLLYRSACCKKAGFAWTTKAFGPLTTSTSYTKQQSASAAGTAFTPDDEPSSIDATTASTTPSDTYTIRGSVNSVNLIGTVVADAQQRTIKNGSIMTTFTVVTSERVKKGDTIEEQSTFHNIVSFDNSIGTNGYKYIKKGNIVHLKGKLTYREVKKEALTYTTSSILVSQASDLTVIYGKAKRQTQ